MRQWIIAGDSDVAFEAMKQAILDIMPGLKATSFQTKRCLVTYTPHGYPFIDQIDDGFYVVTGGNGSSAKSSDAIGKLAADLVIHDEWVSALDRSSFRAVFA
jgi:glycine/D-amino acid oxidase-like deaminating enzyme